MIEPSKKNRILIITGPTAVGKTELSIYIAKALNSEIISSDSMQIYKHMDIGSAKPSKAEREACKHHLIDFVDPKDGFSVAQYQKTAIKCIDELISQGKVPIVSGGTGLYINSIIYDLDFSVSPAQDQSVRKELYKRAEKLGKDAIHDELKKLNPDIAERIHPNNLKRTVRAIETVKLGKPIEDFSEANTPNPKYSPLIICINRDRKELYERINKRVDIMIEKGLSKEVENLQKMGLSKDNISMLGIGYKEMIEYISGELKFSEAIDKIKKNTRHYAKRQITWMKRYKDAKWFNISEYASFKEFEESVREWAERKL